MRKVILKSSAPCGRWQILKPDRIRIVMWGAGNQGRVNEPILRSLGCECAAVVDEKVENSPFANVPLLRSADELDAWLLERDPADFGLVIAIGNPFGHVRRALHARLVGRGLVPVSLVDLSAQICASARVGHGLQAMPQSIVHNNAVIGAQCILNTRSLVEHDCLLEDGVEIGPSATLCGHVHVGANTWIGAGATVKPHIRIGKNVIVGIGAAVISDVPEGTVVAGVPARPIPGKTTPSAMAEAGQR